MDCSTTGGGCCADSALGAICYNTSAHVCCQGRTLCGLDQSCCDNICYDPATFQCCNNALIQLNEPCQPIAGLANATEVNLFNGLLGLELLKTAFVNQSLARFSDQELTSAISGLVHDEDLADKAVVFLRSVAGQEQAHINMLTTYIQYLGGTPVQPCTYNFNIASANDNNGNNSAVIAFLNTTSYLQNLAVSAYLGAITLLTTQESKSLAASIVTAHARHATFFETLIGEQPFPQSFDTARSLTQINQATQQWITSCP